MKNLQKGRTRRQNIHRTVCYLFVVAVGLLYLTNLVVRAAVYRDPVMVLLRDFLLPVALVSGIYAVDWKRGYSSRLIGAHIPKVKMLAICAPVVAALLSFITYRPQRDTVDFAITIFAMTSIYIAPYALQNVQRAAIAIAAQAVGFILLAAKLGNNTAAMVTVAITALVLICCLPNLDWFNRNEENLRAKVTVAAVALLAAFLLLLLIPGTGVGNAFWLSAQGRPGLGSSAFKNAQCLQMLQNARFLGAAMDNSGAGIFENRVLTLILARGGWLAVMPVLFALVTVIVAGIYLCHRSVAIQYYISVSFLAVITVQILGYILMCAGMDQLLFPQLCPFLDGGCGVNTLVLLMAVCILPPKQKYSYFQ